MCTLCETSQKHKISKLWTQICHRTLATGLLFSLKVEIMSLDGRWRRERRYHPPFLWAETVQFFFAQLTPFFYLKWFFYHFFPPTAGSASDLPVKSSKKVKTCNFSSRETLCTFIWPCICLPKVSSDFKSVSSRAGNETKVTRRDRDGRSRDETRHETSRDAVSRQNWRRDKKITRKIELLSRKEKFWSKILIFFKNGKKPQINKNICQK